MAERTPEVQVQRSDDDRRGAGIPILPIASAAPAKGFGAQLALLLSSKLGMAAAMFGLAIGAAGLGALTRRGDLARGPSAASGAGAGQGASAAAGAAAAPAGVVDGAQGAKDGMAYVSGGAAGGSGSAEGFGDRGPGKLFAGDAAGGGKEAGASGSDGSKAADGAAEVQGAAGAQALAAAAAAAAQAPGAAGGAGAKTQLAKVPGFSSGGSPGGGAGGGGGPPPKAESLGQAGKFKQGVEASVRQGAAGGGARERLVATGRRTSGVGGSKGMGNLLSMAPTMQGNKTGSEAGSARQTLGFDSGQAPSAQLSASAPGLSSSGGGLNSAGAGLTPGEGGPAMGGSAGGGGSSLTNVPDIPAYANVTPYQWAIDIGKMLMLVIMVLAIVSAIAKKFHLFGAGVLKMIYGITAALGAILALLGVYMLAMGQFLQGGIWTILGSVTAIIALKNIDDTGKEAEEATKKAIEENGKQANQMLKGQAPQGGQTPYPQPTNAAASTNTTLSVKGADGAVTTQSYNSGTLTTSIQNQSGTTTFVRAGMPYTPQNPGFAGHIFSGTYPTTTTSIASSFTPAAGWTGLAGTWSGGALATAGLAGAGFAHEAVAKNNKSGIYDDSDHRQRYIKKYGVDPVTNQVVNKVKFDKKYGQGAADQWNAEHQDLD